MLVITIPATEAYDETNEEFVNISEQTLRLEHSLVSISKWESKYHKPFLSNKPKNDEEVRYYIKCMTITQNVDPNVYKCLTSSNISDINKYIDDSMTATTFFDNRQIGSREVVTSELIYYWMISFGIPMECQKWHLNRLLTLIRVCSVKNAPTKKMSKNAIMNRYASLNAARRNKYHTKG